MKKKTYYKQLGRCYNTHLETESSELMGSSLRYSDTPMKESANSLWADVILSPVFIELRRLWERTPVHFECTSQDRDTCHPYMHTHTHTHTHTHDSLCTVIHQEYLFLIKPLIYILLPSQHQSLVNALGQALPEAANLLFGIFPSNRKLQCAIAIMKKKKKKKRRATLVQEMLGWKIWTYFLVVLQKCLEVVVQIKHWVCCYALQKRFMHSNSLLKGCQVLAVMQRLVKVFKAHKF